ncbi:MAG: hypothetical protein U1E36_01660 [Rickettsiales bacterium]
MQSSTAGSGQAFEDYGPYNATAGEESMWRAVIVQALMDASSLSRKPENQFHKREALIWLRGTSEDFHRVCHFAGFEPSFVRQLVKEALERGCQWRIAPGMGERGMRSRETGDRRDPTARR